MFPRFDAIFRDFHRVFEFIDRFGQKKSFFSISEHCKLERNPTAGYDQLEGTTKMF